MVSDFNPEFSFDFGGPEEGRTQAAWEFSGALKEAHRERENDKTTSIDHKIAQQLRSKAQRAEASGKPSGKAAPGKGASSRHEARSESGEDSDESDDEESDDEDAPLPGELDDDDSDVAAGDVVGIESDEDEPEEADDDDESDELEEEQADASGRHSRDVADARVANGRSAAAGDDDEEEEESSESEDDEEQPEDSSDEEMEEEGTARQEERRRSHGEAGPASGGPDAKFYAETPDGTRFSAGAFSDLHLSRPLLKACAALGYTDPTPIQAACIPLALAGRDICGSAITGSGKTAAFALPLLERLLFRNRRIAATYALVLTPTRELAVQVHSMITKLAQFTDIRIALVVGGLSVQVQAATLRTSPEVVVATPGRLIDHLRNTQSVGLEDLQALVLDEADRLLQMGFAEEIKEVLRLTPRKRQTLLFSATMTEEVRDLVALSLQRPVRLAADAAGAAPKALTQEVVRFKGAAGPATKEGTLLALCSRSFRSGRTIVFFSTKHSAHRAKILFGLAGLPPAAELHGNMTQAARLESLEKFRKGEAAFLLATDVAARGLDILGVDVVINYDPPPVLSSYLHRIGRTARAGRAGRAVTFADDSTRALLKDVVKKTGAKLLIRTVQPEVVEQWSSRIHSLERDIQRVNLAEREEMELRKAEMEAQKAENMVEHEAEIAARPPRTWFQTGREKAAAADRAREGELGLADDSQGGKKGKAAKKDREREERKRKRGEADAAEKQRKRNKLLEETEGVAGKVRAAKSREHQLRQEGMTGTRAGRAAAAAVAAVKTKQQKKKKGKSPNKGASLGEGEGAPSTPGRSHVYPGGGRSGKVKAAKPGMSKAVKNKLKRHGAGVHGFKSKARHKRR
ncbi:g10221 [Coccomyxa elongata]